MGGDLKTSFGWNSTDTESRLEKYDQELKAQLMARGVKNMVILQDRLDTLNQIELVYQGNEVKYKVLYDPLMKHVEMHFMYIDPDSNLTIKDKYVFDANHFIKDWDSCSWDASKRFAEKCDESFFNNWGKTKDMSDDTINDWSVTRVVCDICTKEWLAVTDEVHDALQCPNCNLFVNFEELEL